MKQKKIFSILSSALILLLLLTQSTNTVYAKTLNASASTKVNKQHINIKKEINFIKNGTFDDGIKNWSNAYPAKALIINENNNRFLRIITGTEFGNITGQKVTDLEPNTAYTLSVDSREHNYGAEGIGASVGLYNTTGESSSTMAPVSESFKTQKLTLKTANDGVLLAIIVMEQEIGDGQADFDNFILTKAE